ncbi:MAG: 50S ribosomal protein L4 [Candidatus Omnitrophica bacterium]|nr:50S ribosomal protein L4 [Candidatus Omnitrophota bacterium]
MPEIDLHNLEGQKIGSLPLPKSLEGPADKAVLWQAVRMYLANQRQGTADTKTRGEVSGGGKKPWAQKHTGRARAGSIRSPLWRGGGIVFGPHPREYRYQLPAQIRRKALVESLKAKVSDQAVKAVESFEQLQPKTKALGRLLQEMKVEKGALLVTDRPSPLLVRISRNLPRVAVKPASDLNCYDVLSHHQMVVTSEGLKQLEARVSC